MSDTWSYTYEQMVTMFYPLADGINVEPEDEFVKAMNTELDKSGVLGEVLDAERYDTGYLLRIIWSDYVFISGVDDFPVIDKALMRKLQSMFDSVVGSYLVED